MDTNKWKHSIVNRTRAKFLILEYNDTIRGSIEFFDPAEMEEFLNYVKGLSTLRRVDGKDRSDS